MGDKKHIVNMMRRTSKPEHYIPLYFSSGIHQKIGQRESVRIYAHIMPAR